MEIKTTTLELKGDHFDNVIGVLEHYNFDTDGLGDKLDDAFGWYLYGRHQEGTDNGFEAHYVHHAFADIKKILRTIAKVAKDAKIEEI